MTVIDTRVFRAYDIRGHAENQLSADLYRLMGQAFGSEVRERTKKANPTIAVGRDCRVTSPAFEAALVEGLVASGCKALRIGQTPTPLNYFAICHFDLDAGAQVSASHNPGHDNGLKLSLAKAQGFFGADIQGILKRCQEQRFDAAPGGSAKELDATTPYKTHLKKQFTNVAAGLTIGVDGGNGVAGPLYTEILGEAGASISGLYIEPDGTFPNHHPDPSQHSTLKDLQGIVTGEKLAMGLAFDGDGDRLGVVDEQGKIRSNDEILLLMAKDMLSRNPGNSVVCTVTSSGLIPSEMEKMGGKAHMSKVGRSFVQQVMQREGALLGGETSGHFLFAEGYYGVDDAVVAALRVLDIVKRAGKPLSQILAEFPTVHQAHERRPHCDDDKKGAVVKAVTEHFQKTNDVATLDGARISFDGGAWVGIRQSNTTPCLTISIEARSAEQLKELETMVVEYFQNHHGMAV